MYRFVFFPGKWSDDVLQLPFWSKGDGAVRRNCMTLTVQLKRSCVGVGGTGGASSGVSVFIIV